LNNLSRLFDAELTGTEERADTEAHLKPAPTVPTLGVFGRKRVRPFAHEATNLGPGFRAKVMHRLGRIRFCGRLRTSPDLGSLVGLGRRRRVDLGLVAPHPEIETASADPTGLLAFASTSSLPSNPLPDWITEVNP
jgi:hypothetical protein